MDHKDNIFEFNNDTTLMAEVHGAMLFVFDYCKEHKQELNFVLDKSIEAVVAIQP